MTAFGRGKVSVCDYNTENVNLSKMKDFFIACDEDIQTLILSAGIMHCITELYSSDTKVVEVADMLGIKIDRWTMLESKPRLKGHDDK